MSTYQYYEFQAIDRPLTEEEQQAVAGLSSRVQPHPWQAAFVYHWSDFPADPTHILARYYDAMLYVSNWGSRQIMFRFPAAALDLERADVYCQPLIVQDYVAFSTEVEYTILNIEFHDEDGHDWVEGEGWLPALLGLRNDILHGDYRALYLAWLKVLQVEDLLPSVLEPPVPPGLKALSPALHAFASFFEIDEALVRVAARTSGERVTLPDDWLRQAIAQLPAEEHTTFLLRLARGEPHLSAGLNRRLRQLLPLAGPEAQPRRAAGQLRRQAHQEREQERRRKAEEAEARRIRELDALAQRQPEAWAEVETLIQKMQSKPYDEAVDLLVRLRDLARYQGEETAFQQHLDRICKQYSRRPALLRRLRDAGLADR